MNWFYSPDGTERFEVSEAVLLQLVQDGKVTPDTLVWREALADWTAAGAANPDWFRSRPVDLPPPAGLEPPVELPPRVGGTPTAPGPTEMSPWARPTAASPQNIAADPPAAAPSAVEITLPPPPPPAGDHPLALSQPAPPPPAYPATAMPPQPRDSAAMSSVISGSIGLLGSVSGFCCCFGTLIAPLAGVTAVVFGHMAYNKTKGHPEAERDKGLATVGLVLGYLTLALTVGGVLFHAMTMGLSAALQNLHRP